MILEYFVNIKPVFTDDSERNLEKLKKVYQKRPELLTHLKSAVGTYIGKQQIEGKSVFLKPNWVKHDFSDDDQWCMRTHESFVLSVLEMVLQSNPAKVLIADAPIQGCHWEKMVKPEFHEEVNRLSEKFSIPVQIKDLRRVTFDPSRNNPIMERNPLSEYTIFDLGKQSYLEPISRQDKNLFRVTNYNPDRLALSHGPGVHKYCITNELFISDVIISLPKVKTHQKAGITAALKNIVGLNGDKDFLPHHRLGGTGFGGDCYPGNNVFRYLSELSLDFANRRQGKFSYWLGYKFSSLLWRLSFPGKLHHIAAAWYGNDTTWRMVMDLNTIAVYGKKDGTIAKQPQRLLYSLCDGIIGGQGDGPLKPLPLPLGIISFTNHSGFNDLAMAKLMGFNTAKIPLLATVKKILNKQDIHISWNDTQLTLEDLKQFSIHTIAPPGWEDYLNVHK
jgi:uncharacterized protein (DUF362 family)